MGWDTGYLFLKNACCSVFYLILQYAPSFFQHPEFNISETIPE